MSPEDGPVWYDSSMRWLLLLLVLLAVPHLGLAQSLDSLGISSGAELLASPDYPEPGVKTTITLNDYRSVSSGATVRWFYNGAAIPDATNAREVSVTAPEVGKTATIKAVLEYGGIAEILTKDITPIYLDVVLEPQTHVPSFYLGRALPSIGSTVRAIALMNNGTPLGTDYIYTWHINNTVINSGPVHGGNVVNFKIPQGNTAILSLEVASPSGDTIAKRVLVLPSVTPELHFYEVNTLLGLLPRAIDRNFNLIGNSSIIRTEPYYLDSATFNNPSILTWKINNRPATPDSNPYEITLEKTGDPGNAAISFEVRSLVQLLQGVKGTLNLSI